jgi:hypothetical protein
VWEGDEQADRFARRDPITDTWSLPVAYEWMDHLGRETRTTAASYRLWQSVLLPEDFEDPGVADFSARFEQELPARAQQSMPGPPDDLGWFTGSFELDLGPWVWGLSMTGEHWAVLPLETAEYWSRVNDALYSGSWDEVREAVGEELWDTWFDGDSPEVGATFSNPDEVPGVGDSYIPPPLGALMLDSLPEDLTDDHTHFVEGMMHFDRLEIRSQEDAEAIVSALRRMGLTVQRRDDLFAGLL